MPAKQEAQDWLRYGPPWTRPATPARSAAAKRRRRRTDLHAWPAGVAYAINGTTGDEITYDAAGGAA